MQKFFSVFACVLVMFLLIGCGGGGGSSDDLPQIEVMFLSGSTSQMAVAMVPGEGDVVQFEITYLVTAIGGDIYVDNTCTGGGVALLPEDGNVFEIGEDVLVWIQLTADGDALGSSFLVEEGETAEFTLTVIAEARASGFAQLVLEGIGWSPFPGEGTEMLVLPEGEFETMSVFLDYMEGFPQPLCSDNVDNDGDGDFDFPDDHGCEDPQDDSESDVEVPGGKG